MLLHLICLPQKELLDCCPGTRTASCLPQPCVHPRPQNPGCSGCTHTSDPSSVITLHSCTRPLLSAGQNLEPSSLCECLCTRPLLCLCAMSTYTSETSATTTRRVPISWTQCQEVSPQPQHPHGRRRDQEAPAAFTTEDLSGPHNHLQVRTPCYLCQC